jgi:hypothetical protein
MAHNFPDRIKRNPCAIDLYGAYFIKTAGLKFMD